MEPKIEEIWSRYSGSSMIDVELLWNELDNAILNTNRLSESDFSSLVEFLSDSRVYTHNLFGDIVNSMSYDYSKLDLGQILCIVNIFSKIEPNINSEDVKFVLCNFIAKLAPLKISEPIFTRMLDFPTSRGPANFGLSEIRERETGDNRDD